MERSKNQNPAPFNPERVGHPEGLNQSLGVDVLEWYHPIVKTLSLKMRKGGHLSRS
jgi:hypothetical protein